MPHDHYNTVLTGGHLWRADRHLQLGLVVRPEHRPTRRRNHLEKNGLQRGFKIIFAGYATCLAASVKGVTKEKTKGVGENQRCGLKTQLNADVTERARGYYNR